jgi:trehalose-phosphatase
MELPASRTDHHELTTPAAAIERARPMLATRPILVVSDFDGTLAQLNIDPWGARIMPAAQRALRRLAAIPGVEVVLLSGRTALDLASRARIGGATYLGNHGVEHGRLSRGSRPERLEVDVVALPHQFAEVAAQLAREVPRLVAEPWLVVERKGAAVTFHFRGAPDVPVAAEAVRNAVESLDPDRTLVRFHGRRALELRPPGAPAKGEAMRDLLLERRPGAAFTLGDDRSDALAFDAMRSARAAGDCAGLAIAVAAHPDGLADVAPHADLVLNGPADAARFLAGLGRVLAASEGRG